MTKVVGFTLVEVLVVIGIIGILCSLLFAAIQNAKKTAQKAKCLSNLRQAGAALLLYAADSRNQIDTGSGGNVASANIWGGRLVGRGYLSDRHVLRCPVGKPRFAFTVSGWPWSTFGMNMYEIGKATTDNSDLPVWRLRLTDVPNHARHWILADSGEEVSSTAFYQTFRVINDASVKTGVTLYHNKQANVLFLDGHVESLDRVQLTGLGCKRIFDERPQ